MSPSLLPQALLAWLRRRRAPAADAEAAPVELRLQCVGIDPEGQRLVRERLPRLGGVIGARLLLTDLHGDVLLIDDALLRSVSPALLSALAEGRPRLVLRRTGLPTAAAPRGVDLDDLAAQLQQLHDAVGLLPLGRTGFWNSQADDDFETQPRGLDSGYDADFDSRWPAQLQPGRVPAETAAQTAAEPAAGSTAFFEAALQARTDPLAPPVQGAYAGGGVLIVNGATARAFFDAEGWMSLRLHEPLPRLQAHVVPNGELAEHDLDLVLWMLGMAAGERPLLGAPADWWHAPLTPVHLQSIGRYTFNPSHLAMARVLAGGGITPSVLRRACRVSERELRGFLQACLVLCLVWWRPALLPTWAEEPEQPVKADHARITPSS